MTAVVSHICAFFDSAEAEYQALVPYTRDCLHSGGRCVHFFDAGEEPGRMQRLARAVDIDQAAATGQFESRDWGQTYLQGGHFDLEATLALVERMLRERRGFPFTWGWGDMGWGLSGLPGSDQIIEYESRLNTVLQPGVDRIMCAYDVRQHDAAMVLDILCTHPLVMAGGEVRTNPLFVPPERFLPAYGERRALQGRRAPEE